jgi:2-polyprenyl-3-methyl-5-hydroxy-6-metoxy-1,4-benzoquinol methylase
VDPAYGAKYAELHARHWWWRARERVVVREMERLRPPDGWRRALDVGCGDGLFFEMLERFADEVEGVEPDAALVSRERRAEGRIQVRPFDREFRPGHSYDLMLFLDVLEHIPDAEAAVEHACTLLAPGGVVLATVPAFRHLWTAHDDLNHHVTRYTRTGVERLLSRSLTVERSRYFFRWMYPAKLAQRVRESVWKREPAPPAIPPAPLNGFLYGLSRVEEMLLARVPVPLGSSVLTVARKPER